MVRNVEQGPSTVRLPASVPPPAGFRGPVILDPTHCLACGICAYVCVSEAIVGVNEERSYGWRYDPGRCTFCARCVERCPGKALSMVSAPAPAYSRPGELVAQRRVPFPQCPDCGRPTRPVTKELLHVAFENVEELSRERLTLCERCRRRRLQRSMMAAAYDSDREDTR
jgi:formate hydrogenlyase subunit 6